MSEEHVYHWWPIRFLLGFKYGCWKQWFVWHGVCESKPHCYWVYHLGPIKIVFGKKTAEQFKAHFENGLTTGLKFEGFTREWMLKQREGGIR